jgi:hypothetical protein
MLAFIVGFLIGAFCGVACLAILVASRENDY